MFTQLVLGPKSSDTDFSRSLEVTQDCIFPKNNPIVNETTQLWIWKWKSLNKFIVHVWKLKSQIIKIYLNFIDNIIFKIFLNDFQKNNSLLVEEDQKGTITRIFYIWTSLPSQYSCFLVCELLLRLLPSMSPKALVTEL